MRIAYGLIAPDTGTIELTARRRRLDQRPAPSLRRARRAAPESAWCTSTSRRFPRSPSPRISRSPRGGLKPVARRNAGRRSLVERLGLPLRASDHVESLSAQLRQRLEIVKALAADATVLLLDEPTAVLAPREVDELLRFLRGLRRRGRHGRADHPQARRSVPGRRSRHGAAARRGHAHRMSSRTRPGIRWSRR